MPLNVAKIQVCPAFVKTTQEEYINANNITKIKPLNDKAFIIEAVEGSSYVSTHTINKEEAGKIIDFNA